MPPCVSAIAGHLACDPQCATGARRGREGAEAVLKLRALVGNGDFDGYFAFHLKQEKTRSHDRRCQRPKPRAA